MSGEPWCCNECKSPLTPNSGTPCFKEDKGLISLTIPSSIPNVNPTSHKPNKLVLFDTDETNRPLLNDKDLDPDTNFFPHLLKECKYYSTTELSNKSQMNLSSFAVMHINSRSLLPKIDEISHLLNQIPTSILAVTETWLTDTTASPNLISG